MRKLSTKKVLAIISLIAWMTLMVTITQNETISQAITMIIAFLVGMGYETTNGVDKKEP